jgi:hypothetical protein
MSKPITIHILAADTGLQAHVVRAAAEHYGATVSVTWAGNSSQVVDYLSSRPVHDLIILSFHGDDRGMLLPPLAEECRSLYPYFDVICPADFAQFLALDGNIVLSHACSGGIPAMAEAFLSGGAAAYVGAEGDPNTAASTKYVLDFLYGYLIEFSQDVEKSHLAAKSGADDRGMFRLFTSA